MSFADNDKEYGLAGVPGTKNEDYQSLTWTQGIPTLPAGLALWNIWTVPCIIDSWDCLSLSLAVLFEHYLSTSHVCSGFGRYSKCPFFCSSTTKAQQIMGYSDGAAMLHGGAEG